MKIKSFIKENTRLRKDNVEMKKRLGDSEYKRAVLADLLNQHMKIFVLIE